jgi:hypothetical protein
MKRPAFASGGVIGAIALACAAPTGRGGLTPASANDARWRGLTADGYQCSLVSETPPTGCTAQTRDEFRGETALHSVIPLGLVELTLISAPDSDDATSRRVLVSVNRSSSEWQYLRCHTLDFLADGRPVPLPEARHDGNVRSGGVYESVQVHVPVDTLERLARAATVRGRVCADEFSLYPSQIRTIRDFVARWHRISPPVPSVSPVDASAPAASDGGAPEASP